MTATILTARDDIIGLFRTAWLADATSAGVALLYWDVPASVPTAKDADGNMLPWARITVRHLTGEQATLSNESGVRRWRRTGIVTVQVFTAFGTGLSTNDELSMIAARAFEGASTSSGVWFRNVSVQEIGQDEAWFQTNVVAEFEYDEVR